MDILFATSNPAKIKYYAQGLHKENINVLTIKNIEVELDINENGKDAIENAIIKAKAYHDYTGFTTIAMDDNLFIEGLPDEEQPKTHIRRINGKRLNDSEMIEYYSNIAKKLGGRINCYWIKGVAICKEGQVYTYSIKTEGILVDKTSEKITEGYPLNSITIVPDYNKYYSELTDEEVVERNHSKNKKLFDFINSNIM